MPDNAHAASAKDSVADSANTALNYHQRNFHLHSYASLLRKQAVELIRNILHSLKPKTVILVVVAAAILAVFGRNLKDIMLVAVLGLMASYSTIYKRTIRVPSAVELVTLGTVITGAAYGPAVGATFGVITTFASEIISSGVDVNTLFYSVARGVTGGVAQFLVVTLGLNIVVVGMIALVIFHAISDVVYILAGDVEAKLKVIYYLFVNTLFNFLVFSFFGRFLLSFARL